MQVIDLIYRVRQLPNVTVGFAVSEGNCLKTTIDSVDIQGSMVIMPIGKPPISCPVFVLFGSAKKVRLLVDEFFQLAGKPQTDGSAVIRIRSDLVPGTPLEGMKPVASESGYSRYEIDLDKGLTIGCQIEESSVGPPQDNEWRFHCAIALDAPDLPVLCFARCNL